MPATPLLYIFHSANASATKILLLVLAPSWVLFVYYRFYNYRSILEALLEQKEALVLILIEVKAVVEPVKNLSMV
jgi:hypothetical protein